MLAPQPGLAAALSSQYRWLLRSGDGAPNGSPCEECLKLADFFGAGGCLSLLRVLLEDVDLRAGGKAAPKVQVLGRLLGGPVPNLPSLFCQAAIAAPVRRDSYLGDLCNSVDLPLERQVELGLALAQAPHPGWSAEGVNFLKGKVSELVERAVVLPEALRHGLLAFVKSNRELFGEHAAGVEGVCTPGSAASGGLSPLIALEEEGRAACCLVYGLRASPQSVQTMAAQLTVSNSLAGVMRELGYSCTANERTFREVLGQFSTVDEVAVAGVLGMMATTHSGLEAISGMTSSLTAILGSGGLAGPAGAASQAWDVELVVDGLKCSYPSLDWGKVPGALDYEGFELPDQQSLCVLMCALRHARTDPFPLSAVLGKVWDNRLGQLSFLRAAVAAPPEVFTFAHSCRKTSPVEGLQGGKSPMGSPNEAWLSIDLLETLCKLGEAGHIAAVRQILEQPMKHCQEVLLISASAVKTGWGVVQQEVCLTLAPLFLQPHPNSQAVLRRLWPSNRDAVVRAMAELYAKDATHISRVLDVAQELKGLTVVLGCASYGFAVELAALASRREYLNLEKWLKDRISSDGLPFIEAVMQFLDGKLQQGHRAAGTQSAQAGGRVMLAVETLAIFLRVLQMHASVLPPDVASSLKKLQLSAVAAHPQLQSATAQPETEESFASDIEEEANSYFQQIYNEQTRLEDVIQMLRRYKSSSQQREREVFACMVHNLFDEYRFFPKYPPKELNITAVLFGQLIHHQLVSSITLGIAQRYVLDALRKPPDSVMFKFGLSAIQQFKNELAGWPAYCGDVLAEPHIKEADPELVAFIEHSMENMQRNVDVGGPADSSKGTQCANSSTPGPAGPLPGLREASLTVPGRAPLDQPNGLETEELAGPAPQTGNPSFSNQVDAGPARGAAEELRGAEAVQMNGMQQLAAPPIAQSLSKLPAPAEVTGAQSSVEDIENGPKAQLASAPQSAAPASGSSTPSLATINAETLESAAAKYSDFPVPPEKSRDRFIFLLNNLSAHNVMEKVGQVEELLEDDYLQWAANYLVVKRAAQEANFHVLYVKLLDQLDNKKLLEFVVRATHHYVRVLLDSERIKTEMSDRSLLKNLGSWLGQLTLGKNRPLRQKDLDLKAIIYEAYERGKMVAVIPFVHKVLEPGKDSKVYGPNNPWIKSILALLAEIYTLEGLKMNLTFEIEMIFKDYNLGLGDVGSSKGLEECQREMVNNGDFYEKKAPEAQEPDVELKPVQAVGPPNGSSLNPLMDPVYTGGLASSQQQIMALHNMRQGNLEVAEMAPFVPPPVPRPALNPFGPAPPAPLDGLGAGGQIAGTDAASLLGQLAGTLHQLVTINPSLNAVAERVPLKRLISVGIDRAIYEIITPVVNRSVTIACTTTKELVTKDFAMEPDESKLRRAAHLMVSSLAGSLALVTCKEPLKVSLQSQLKSVLQGVLDASILEQTITIVINDNLDLGCTIIERASTDKAIKEVDERLVPFYQARQKARAAGTPFYDMSIFTKGGGRFPASLPDSLRPRPGHLNPQQTGVYYDFARIPRAGNSSNVLRMPGMDSSGQLQLGLTSDQYPMVQLDKPASLAEGYALWQQRIDALISKEAAQNQSDFSGLPETSEVHHALAQLVELVGQPPNRDEAASGVAEKIFLHMYDGQNRLHASVLTAALTLLRTSGSSRLPASVTSWFCQVTQDEGRRFNAAVADSLIRANLMVFPKLDLHLARCLASGQGGPVAGCVEFVLHLVKRFMIDEGTVRASELASTLDLLRRLALKSPDGDQILRLIDQVRVLPGDSDPEGLRDRVAGMFDGWATVVHSDPTDAKIKACVEGFAKAGLLKGDDITGRLLRICAELSVLHCVNTEVSNAQGQRPGDGRMSFVMIDAFVKLVVTLLEVTSGVGPGLRKVLEIVVRVLHRDHDERGTLYNSRPYFRIFYGLFQELLPRDGGGSPGLETIAPLACALVSCRPQRMPGFTFSWLELVSHRTFMARLLKLPDRQGWPYFRSLFMGLLLFMQPYLRHAELGETLRLLYCGVMRMMLVLLHDFPEFLCDYHLELCNVIPPSCVQMRNLILSAFPSHMRLPDPFTPNLKVDLLVDINKEPSVFPEVSDLLSAELKLGVDQYIKTRSPPGFLDELPQRLMLAQDVAKLEGTSYNVTLMNSVVLYTGMLAIRYVKNKPGASLVQYGPAMDIFHKLANDLDTEGRYLFLNAVANQLRFPNSHTHYFSCILLVLFLEARERVLQEQITRVLLERLIVHRPHPWGLLITFIELIKNKRYRFWELGITRCAPEIEHLFESVARSCLPQSPDDLMHQDIAVASAVRALE